MHCRLCDRWYARLSERSHAWERTHSNESDLWALEPLRNRELIDRACAIRESDPAAAFGLYLEAAEAGSAWALEQVASHYEKGTAVAADFDKAEDYYRRAITAGSWMATLYYAGFLADRGRHDEWRRLLEDGVAADFIPAYYWLARLGYDLSPSRELCRQIRPLLEHAGGHGHPRAQVFLSQLMTWGKFGLREIPAGLALAVRLGARSVRDEEEAPAIA